MLDKHEVPGSNPGWPTSRNPYRVRVFRCPAVRLSRRKAALQADLQFGSRPSGVALRGFVRFVPLRHAYRDGRRLNDRTRIQEAVTQMIATGAAAVLGMHPRRVPTRTLHDYIHYQPPPS